MSVEYTQRPQRPWLVLVAVALGVSMIGLDGSVVAVANPAIGRYLNASVADLQWVTNAYLLALAATLILGGKLGDRFGRRKIYLFGVIGFTLASIAIGASSSMAGVIVFRSVQGICGGMLLPNTLGLLRAAFVPRQFTMAVGVWAMVSSASTALGPIVGGFLVERVNWQSIFLLNVPLGLIAVVFGSVVLQRTPGLAQSPKFDLPGVAMFAVGQIMLVFGIIKGETWGWLSWATLVTICSGSTLLILFCWYQTRILSPLLPTRLFRDRSLAIGASMTALNFFVLLGSLFFLMLFVQNIQRVNSIEAGLRVLPLSAATLLAAPLGAALTSRFGARPGMTIGMLLLASAVFMMLTWTAQSGYSIMWPPLVGLGLGSGLVMSATTEAVVAGVPEADAGVAGGIQSTAIQIGGALGISVLVSLIRAQSVSTFPAELRDAGVPLGLIDTLSNSTDGVASGIAPMMMDIQEPFRAAVVEATGAAFVNGLHAAVVAAGLLCVAGALLSCWGVRRLPYAMTPDRAEPAGQGDVPLLNR